MAASRINLLKPLLPRSYAIGGVEHKKQVESSSPGPIISREQAIAFIRSENGLGKYIDNAKWGEKKYSDDFFRDLEENENEELIQDQDRFLILTCEALVELDVFFRSRLATSRELCFAKWSVIDEILLLSSDDYSPHPYEDITQPFEDLKSIIHLQVEKPPHDFWDDVSKIRLGEDQRRPIINVAANKVVTHIEILWHNPELVENTYSYRDALVHLLTDNLSEIFENRKRARSSKPKHKPREEKKARIED